METDFYLTIRLRNGQNYFWIEEFTFGVQIHENLNGEQRIKIK